MDYPSNVSAYYSARYGWILKLIEDEVKMENNCKNCGHGCHCSNGSSCQSCDCKNCEHTVN